MAQSLRGTGLAQNVWGTGLETCGGLGWKPCGYGAGKLVGRRSGAKLMERFTGAKAFRGCTGTKLDHQGGLLHNCRSVRAHMELDATMHNLSARIYK